MEIKVRGRTKIALIPTILGLAAIYLCFFNFTNAPINADAGYYLSVAGALARGSILYRDIRTYYTPLGFYLLNILRFIGDLYFDGYSSYLFGIYLTWVINCVLLYWILSHLTVTMAGRFTTCMMFLLLTQVFEGKYIVLEPFVILFWLCGLLVVVSSKNVMDSKRLLAAGVCVSAAFLTKQYGLILALPIVLWIIKTPAAQKLKFRAITTFLIGLVVPIAALAAFFICVYQVPAPLLISSIRRSEYIAIPPLDVASMILIATFALPLLLVLSLPDLRNSSTSHRFEQTIAFFGLFTLLPLFIRQYLHYFLLAVPFEAISLAILLPWLNFETSNTRRLSIALASLLSAVTVGTLAVDDYIISASNVRARQLQLAENLKRHSKLETPVMLLASPAYYYLADLTPFDLKAVGPVAMISFSELEIKDWVSKCELIIIDLDSTAYFGSINERFLQAGRGLIAYIESEGFSSIEKYGSVLVFRKSH